MSEAKSNDNMYVIPCTNHFLQGMDLLSSRVYNKGSAFTKEERQFLNLEGLLPPQVFTQDEQADRVKLSLDRAPDDLARYSTLMDLSGRNQKLFYYVMQKYVVELLPIVYTPTVGLACQKFGTLYKRSRGMYISLEMKGRVRQALRHWPARRVRAIVFTDGERILGLGDLGTCGMGIPLGKLALYTALGGVCPCETLPVTIDVGTNNEKFLKDEFYTGLRRTRERGPAYDELIDEFIQAAKAEFGENVLLQFEDFGNANAFRMLRKYKDTCCTFNDDIQGTASVVTAGVLAALSATGKGWEEHTFLFVGAGSAGLGIAQLIAEAASKATGKSVEECRQRIWCIDSRGLVFKGRKSGGINSDKAPFAHEWADADTLGGKIQPLEVYIKNLGVTGIFGVSAQAGAFTEAAIKQITENTPRPIVFALSNPTSKAECTAEQAYTWSDSKCLFASGSPFAPVTLNGVTHVPGQGNNSYIFPGVALAVISTCAMRVTDGMFLTAAEALAAQVTPEDLAKGTLYPSLQRIKDVSAHIAAAVAVDIYEGGYATVLPRPDNLFEFVSQAMWSSEYDNFCPSGIRF